MLLTRRPIEVGSAAALPVSGVSLAYHPVMRSSRARPSVPAPRKKRSTLCSRPCRTMLAAPAVAQPPGADDFLPQEVEDGRPPGAHRGRGRHPVPFRRLASRGLGADRCEPCLADASLCAGGRKARDRGGADDKRAPPGRLSGRLVARLPRQRAGRLLCVVHPGQPDPGCGQVDRPRGCDRQTGARAQRDRLQPAVAGSATDDHRRRRLGLVQPHRPAVARRRSRWPCGAGRGSGDVPVRVLARTGDPADEQRGRPLPARRTAYAARSPAR